MDSATALAVARTDGFECYALSVSYGQRHAAELSAARLVAKDLGAHEHRLIQVNLDLWGGSALTDLSIPVPQTSTAGIPVTYVPARNTIFLALALGWAEVLNCHDIFIGVNVRDYSGYPDCRPEFINAFERLAALATKAGISPNEPPLKIHSPLIDRGKDEIVRLGLTLGVDFEKTISCYQADAEGKACGRCDACRIRRDGFQKAGVRDPTRYQ